MNNMQQLLQRAQKLQEKLTETQKELELNEVTGTSGSGLISVTMTLKGNVKAISIDKAAINPDDKDMLEDLIVAALNDAKAKGDAMFEKGMSEATAGLNMPKIPGMF